MTQQPDNRQPRASIKLEEIREFSRNLWRAKVLKDREHYMLIQLVDDVERSVGHDESAT